jgi:hypothetical protein
LEEGKRGGRREGNEEEEEGREERDNVPNILNNH